MADISPTGMRKVSATGGLLFKRRPGLLSVSANLPLRFPMILIRRLFPSLSVMGVIKAMNNASDLKLPYDFSLVQGGPLFQFFVRTRLSTIALGWLKRRIIVLSMLTWLPLLLLTMLSGQALDGGLKIPFLYDLEAHVRFLLSLPLLLLTELIVHRKLLPLVLHFIDRGIVTAEARPRFEAHIASALRLRNSLFIEIALLVFVLSIGHSFWFEEATVHVSTWYAVDSLSKLQLSPAGYWFIYFSLPLYQFLVFRWLFRIFIWTRFLWQVSRLYLCLVPTHPDGAAGLGFLEESTYAFFPLIISQSLLLAGMIAERIFYAGEALLAFKAEMTGAVVFLLLIVLGPLCVFMPYLIRTRRKGLLQYGVLASRYVREFDSKWMKNGAASDEAFIGSSDIQSLADLNNSFEVIRKMRSVPFGKEILLQTAVIALLPVLPLTLTMISLEDLVKRLIGILL
ncbi:MAG: hypothetical protein ACXV8P_08065 [Methylobacter sp.]